MNRRDFVQLGALVSAGLLPESLAGIASAFPHEDAGLNVNTTFWLTEIRKTKRPMTIASARNNEFGGGGPGSGLANPSRNPVFAFWDPTTKAFSDATSITPDISDGDVDIDINVARFRPSTADTASFNSIQSGSLRIDVSQQPPSQGTSNISQLAWSAIAGLLPGGGNKLPSLSQLQFNTGQVWGTPNDITLTGGSGTWAWNFFLQKKASIWEKVLTQIHNAIGGGVPSVIFTVLGLPAISVTALGFVDKLVSYLTNVSQEEWLFNSSDTAVTATKTGVMNNPNTVRLKTGWYLVVPQAQAALIPTDDSLRITNAGCLVGKNVVDLQQYSDAASRIPELTYLTLNVKATAKAHSS